MEETGVPGETSPTNRKSLTIIFLDLKYIYIKKKKTMTENKREKYSRNNLQTCLFILFCEINIRLIDD